jgi:hypothetical protein
MNLKMLCFTVFSLFVSAVAFAGPLTLSATLNPAQWNTLVQVTSSAGSAQLSNGQGDIFVGRTNQEQNNAATISIRRGLIEFDIAGNIPSGTTITGGSLTMCDIMGLNGNQTISLYDVLQAWGQGSSNSTGGVGVAATNNDATWYYTFYNAANPSASPTWNTPGGNFSTTLSGSATDPAGSAGQLITWSSPQMANDIQNWLANPSGNFGWLMQGNESLGQTAKRLETPASNDTEGYVPELVVQYTVPTPEPYSAALVASAAALAFTRPFIRRWRRRYRI